jgi:hypothetical protein
MRLQIMLPQVSGHDAHGPLTCESSRPKLSCSGSHNRRRPQARGPDFSDEWAASRQRVPTSWNSRRRHDGSFHNAHRRHIPAQARGDRGLPSGILPGAGLQHLPDDHRVNGIRGDCTRPSAPRMAIPPNGVASSAASPLQAALRGSRRSHYEDIVGGHPAASGRPKVTSCNSVIRTPGFRVTHIRQHYCRQTSCAMASLS